MLHGMFASCWVRGNGGLAVSRRGNLKVTFGQGKGAQVPPLPADVIKPPCFPSNVGRFGLDRSISGRGWKNSTLATTRAEDRSSNPKIPAKLHAHPTEAHCESDDS